MGRDSSYDEKYSTEEYYWGTKPQGICEKVVRMVRPSPEFRPKLLDLGCGEGRNAVYYATQGFRVVGLDLSVRGLEKMRHLAEKVGVRVDAIHADLLSYELQDTYDIIFSTGTLHHLPPDVRTQKFPHYKECTTPNGLNVFSVFVDKPFLTDSTSATAECAFLYRSGELMGYYWDWEILYCAERIFDCRSGGIPHRHAVDRIIARRHYEGGSSSWHPMTM